MKIIWLDVSTVMVWHRPAVGIVRVEAECAAYGLQRLEAAVGSVRFCRFHATSGYQEVSAAEVRVALARIQGRSAAVPKNEPPHPHVVPAVPLERRVTALVLRLINRLPVGLRASAFAFAVRRREAFAAALRGYRELRHAFKTFVHPPQVGFSALMDSGSGAPTPQRPPVPFGPGDVYVSMGLDWDQKDLVYLYEQKRNLGFNVVLFCYDVIPAKFPHLCVGDVAASFARYFANLAWCADKVLCISECSRNDLKALLGELGAPLPDMSVIKLGCQLPVIATDVMASDVAALLGQRFVLFVSTIERRKNHETLYRAYTRLVDAGETNLPLLVFVGMPGWGVNDLMADLRFDPRTKDLIKLLHHVNDADLARLYQHALMTVFPSLYEGWGLPVAESLAAGKCCLASNVASIPEVGGDLVDYVDPWDVPAWAERLRWYFNHPSLVAHKEARIKDSYQPMSWPKCAEDVFSHATGLMIAPPTQQATGR
ncbi:MAG: glycosyltransferase family 1 protein [Polaromonas sp.]|nr:glycosyltransferase family 1 protein [Polaromonas sp.]